jgi:hypothetical protein
MSGSQPYFHHLDASTHRRILRLHVDACHYHLTACEHFEFLDTYPWEDCNLEAQKKFRLHEEAAHELTEAALSYFPRN